MYVSTIAIAFISFLCFVPKHPVQAGPPSPESLRSSLTFLYQNDLDWPSASEHVGAILLEPARHADAVTSCAALGETLLPIGGTFFSSDTPSMLSYLVFKGQFSETQEFWVSSPSSSQCRSISVQGTVRSTSCDQTLPILCSQSAPFRPASDQDKDPKFELTITAQDLTVTGYRDHLSFRFLGLRYGNPPERFTYPTLYSGSQKVFNATVTGSQCVQAGGGSEDCLFLNIFTPFVPSSGSHSTSDDLLPVMFHIHGGAFTSGSANDPTFDGGNMVSRGDVVVVTINYRLSTLGFLALDDGVTNGNFGIADQTVALEWVRKYISSFGGDPNRITIFGQSAGAASVRMLLASPKAIGNFAAAIPMSNLAGADFATTYSLYMTIEQEVTTVANGLISAVGCGGSVDNATVLACLRSVDAQELVNSPSAAKFPVIDGTFVTSKQLPVDGSAPVAHVPVMMGFMRDDGAAIIGFPASSNLSVAISSLLDDPSPASIMSSGLFVEPSGANATLNTFNVTARIGTDIEFRCLDQATAVSALEHDVFSSVFFYQFNRSYQTPGFDPNAPVCDAPIDDAHPFGDPSQEYFKCHSGELFFVWGNLGQSSLPFRDDLDLPFSQFMLDTWASFAHSFNPNPDVAYLRARNYSSTLQQSQESGVWRAVGKGASGQTLKQLGTPSQQIPFQEEDQCAFLKFPFTFFG